MTHPLPNRPMTVEEYFDFEDRSPTRHEFVDGEVFAMSGVTRRHNAISGNVYMRLRTAARGGPCRVHFAEVKLRTGRVVYYPDGMVACGPPPADERLEDAPTLVVEVVSPSTQSTDRREKLMVYKGIPSVTTYLIIDQMQRCVDRHWRDTDGDWRHDVIVDDGAVPVAFGPVSLTLTLDEIYEGVTLPTPEERLRLREEEAVYG
jgi:Uma2 family endonuclease